MFLYFEVAKYNLQIGSSGLKIAQKHAANCFVLAGKINCHPFIVISTILMGSVEFRLGFKKKTSQAFNKAIEYAISIKELGVISFLDDVNFISIAISKFLPKCF